MSAPGETSQPTHAIGQAAAGSAAHQRPAVVVPHERRGHGPAFEIGVPPDLSRVQERSRRLFGKQSPPVDRQVRLPPAAVHDGPHGEIEPGLGWPAVRILRAPGQAAARHAMERETDTRKAGLDLFAAGAIGEKNVTLVDPDLAQVQRQIGFFSLFEGEPEDEVEPGHFALLVADDVELGAVEADPVKDQLAPQQRQQGHADEYSGRGYDGPAVIRLAQDKIAKRHSQHPAHLHPGLAHLDLESGPTFELAREKAAELADFDQMVEGKEGYGEKKQQAADEKTGYSNDFFHRRRKSC